MSTLTLSHEAGIVAQAAHRISTAADYDRLIELAGEAQFVLIGEASHGTHDFYVTRAEPDAPAHRGERLSHRRLGGGLAGHVAGASLRHWPRQRARRGGGAWGFSPISRVDVAQHSDGRIRQLVARLCDTLDARQPDVMNHWNAPDRVKTVTLSPAENRIVLPALSAAAIECEVP
jgi:hypothetical protein